MTAVPRELPIRLPDAAAIAELVAGCTDIAPVNDEIRSRLTAAAGDWQSAAVQPLWGSLSSGRAGASEFYLAVDTPRERTVLLRIAPSNAQGSLFPKSELIGSATLASGREVVLHATPLSSSDWEALSTFAQQVDRSFLPRPQGAAPAIATGNRHPEVSLPAAFAAFRTILDKTGVNMASTVQLSATREMTTDDAIAARDGENPTAAGHTRVSIRHLYHAGLWAAIRAGWRNGYTAEGDHFIISGNNSAEIARSVENAKEAIRHAAGYTKFTTDTSRLFLLEADVRHPHSWSSTAIGQKFEDIFDDSERKWILSEFGRKFDTGEKIYRMDREQILRLAVKFGESLKLNEELYDYIRANAGAFDFEPSIDEAETLTTPEEMIFYMHWLQDRGRPAQLVPPNLGFKKRQAYPETASDLERYAEHKMWPELLPRVQSDFKGNPLVELGARVSELAAVARLYQGTLSIHSGSGKQQSVLEQIGKSTRGRMNYKISGELQLQLLDVLSEQPEGSPWRSLFHRMASRCEEFAAAGAFGYESELATKYKSHYLGDASRGRVDGNLFLVFWIGNMVGSRDVHSPDGDHRFFKEKLDELPANLLEEIRRRNAQYIAWLASCLRA